MLDNSEELPSSITDVVSMVALSVTSKTKGNAILIYLIHSVMYCLENQTHRFTSLLNFFQIYAQLVKTLDHDISQASW